MKPEGDDVRRETRATIAEPESDTLITMLRCAAEEDPAALAFRFLDDWGAEAARRTRAALATRAQAIAVEIRERAGVGDRVLLLHPPGLDFVDALFGCFYAGAIAVPTYPPDPTRIERTIERLRGILRRATPRLLVSTRPLLDAMAPLLDGLDETREIATLATDEVDDTAADLWRAPAVEADAPALLQFTSGSTGAPRGVTLSHANVLANEAALESVLESGPDDCGVAWLPSYHDMGLVGSVLHPLYVGFESVLLAPATFLKHPRRWLEAIGRHRGTIAPAPNFAFDLCVRKIGEEDVQGLDLTSWRVACNGAEPVRAETIDRFAERFASAGFRRETFFPCYGLAEATLIAAGSGASAPPRLRTLDAARLATGKAVAASQGSPNARVYVACGEALPGHAIRIEDPVSRAERAEGDVGEILVAGPSVALGYWDDADGTADAFVRRGANGTARRWLRTGDLGFVQSGELYVTGRSKDVVVVAGRNLYPQDVERSLERAIPGARPGCGAAFGVEGERGEALAVVLECTPDVDPKRAIASARRCVAEEHGIELHAILLIAPGAIPKAPNGKIQRRETRERYLAGRFEPLAAYDRGRGATRRAPRAPELERGLVDRVARELGIDPDEIDLDEPLANQGLSSLSAATVAGEIERWLGVVLEPTALYEHPTVRDLARHLEAGPPASAGPLP